MWLKSKPTKVSNYDGAYYFSPVRGGNAMMYEIPVDFGYCSRSMYQALSNRD